MKMIKQIKYSLFDLYDNPDVMKNKVLIDKLESAMKAGETIEKL